MGKDSPFSIRPIRIDQSLRDRVGVFAEDTFPHLPGDEFEAARKAALKALKE